MKVPEVLLGGNHNDINKWRRRKSLEITLKYRPDLLETPSILSKEDILYLESLKNDK
jgi:tRNA (guanine37-N1)-methyltransferase